MDLMDLNLCLPHYYSDYSDDILTGPYSPLSPTPLFPFKETIDHSSASPPFRNGGGMLSIPNTHAPATNTHAFLQHHQHHHSPPSLEQTPTQQMTDASEEDAAGGTRLKRCRVCGDTATGYNFNVISCESCKAFFRRNALRPKEFKCPYSNECDITAVTRRFCQKCRLQKCFAVGMKKEWILSEDQLRRRKNARVKSQQFKEIISGNNSQFPATPASVASTPATPYGGGNPMDAPTSAPPPTTTTAFSPPQAQNLFHAPHHQQQSPLSATGSPAAMRAALLPQPNGVPSPLALAALSALMQQQSPKGTQQSPATVSIDSPQQQHHHSPRSLMTVENKVSPYSTAGGNGGVQSPPPILPAIHHQQSQPHVTLQNAQRELALALQEQARRASDSLLLGIPQQPQQSPAGLQLQQVAQQLSPNNSGLSPLIEQCHQLLRLGQQQQQLQPLLAATLLQQQQQQQQQQDAKPMLPQLGGLPSDLLHGNPGLMGNSCGSEAMAKMAAFKAMDPKKQQEMMDHYMHETIQKELDLGTCSPPESSRSTPSIPVASADCATPTTSAPVVPDLRAFALNSLEARDLEAVKVAFASMDEDLRAELKRNPKLLMSFMKPEQDPSDVMNILDMVMRRIVKMAKKLPSFNELSQSGKFSLLKAAMIDMLTLRGAARMDAEKRAWTSPLINKELKLNTNFFDQLHKSEQKQRVMKFYEELHETLKKDQVANNLVMVTVLFYHHGDLADADQPVAARQYENHQQLLRRYLESVYGPDEARLIYGTVPSALDKLKDVSDNAKPLFNKVKVEPNPQPSLIPEIFTTGSTTAEVKEEAAETAGPSEK